MSRIFGFDFSRAFDFENGFYLTSSVTRISKLLAHYELYKRILPLSGHVIECGVFKGASFIQLAQFREILESPFSRKIIGFDAFGDFPHAEHEFDKEFIKKFEDEAGKGISDDELWTALKHKGVDRNIELIKGNIIETIPEYLQKNPELRISLLHIDVDVYEPTKTILDNLYYRVVPGGIIMLDDYNTVYGETQAVDDFFENKNEENLSIEKLTISHIPSFIVKKPLFINAKNSTDN